MSVEKEKEIENTKINLLEDKINLLEYTVNKLENIILTTISNTSNYNSNYNSNNEVDLDNIIVYRGIDCHITEPKLVRQHAFEL